MLRHKFQGLTPKDKPRVLEEGLGLQQTIFPKAVTHKIGTHAPYVGIVCQGYTFPNFSKISFQPTYMQYDMWNHSHPVGGVS